MQQTGDMLIVDEEADIVNHVVELLQEEGYQVRSAFNGAMALAAIAQQEPAIILLDMYTPQMTGICAARAYAHKRQPECPSRADDGQPARPSRF